MTTKVKVWDEFSAEDYVTEYTRDTELAHRLAKEAAERQFTHWSFAGGSVGDEKNAELRILSDRGYVISVRGQASATGHGKHGFDPKRGADLHEIREPVWLLFIEPGGNVMYSGWLHVLPNAIWISTMTGAHRQGWWCKWLDRSERLEFPAEIPPPREDLFSGGAA